jgi:hypothetical protein
MASRRCRSFCSVKVGDDDVATAAAIRKELGYALTAQSKAPS